MSTSQATPQSTQEVPLVAPGELAPAGSLYLPPRKHVLDLDDFSPPEISAVIESAKGMAEVLGRDIKKVPTLRGKVIVTLFYESSTRTRSTFELAAKRLSADVLNLDIAKSATSKGETLLDTLRNLEAMAADMFVVRHQDSGAPFFIANEVTPQVAVINAGVTGRRVHKSLKIVRIGHRASQTNHAQLTCEFLGSTRNRHEC